MAKKKAAKKKATRRKKKASTPPPETAVADPQLAEQAVLLLVRHRDAGTARRQLIAEGVDPGTAEATVADARRRLTLAAGYDRVEELGRAIQRLNDLFELARAGLDQAPLGPSAASITSCANIQKEINRLLDLYRPGELPAGELSEESAELRLVRDYLEPFNLGDPELPVSELVRLAVGQLALPE